MESEFESKNYIVTGASSGIGRAVCIELSKQKANVLLIARNEERLRNTLSEMDAAGHMAISFDLSDINGIQNIVKSGYERYGKIDGFIHCAGEGQGASLQKSTYNLLHGMMLVHYYAFVEFVRYLIKSKEKDYPLRIVGVSSVASKAHNRHDTGYSASKAALEAAVRVLSAELVKKNSTINAVCPAYVDTGRQSGLQNLFGDVNEYLKRTGFQPYGMIDPPDVAKLILYLLGDAAKSITGMSVPINGGARF